MDVPKFQAGDIFLCDSDRTGAKIVKFFMTAPTIWQHLWRKITKKQQIVRYYHAGMIITDISMIEQQWKVQFGETPKIMSRRISIYRKKGLTDLQRQEICDRAVEDLGKGYDIVQILGKTLTWLTGIPYFARWFGIITKEQEICVTRVGEWYFPLCKFGVKTQGELTTKIMDEYCASHLDEWELVYTN